MTQVHQNLAEMSASFARTFAASFFLFSASLAAASSSSIASICTESNAALTAPSMATVATGIPDGICTVDRRASMPSKVDDFTGTPITGRVVLAASAPARWAALPAKAMIAPKPFSLAVLENSAACSGVL